MRVREWRAGLDHGEIWARRDRGGRRLLLAQSRSQVATSRGPDPSRVAMTEPEEPMKGGRGVLGQVCVGQEKY